MNIAPLALNDPMQPPGALPQAEYVNIAPLALDGS
jgi:hypothetical protein